MRVIAILIVSTVLLTGCSISWISFGHTSIVGPREAAFDLEIVGSNGSNAKIEVATYLEPADLPVADELKHSYIEQQLTMQLKFQPLPWKSSYLLNQGEVLHVYVRRISGTDPVDITFSDGTNVYRKATLESLNKDIMIYYQPKKQSGISF